MPETAYEHVTPHNHRLEHYYGERVHILADAWALSALARLGHPDTAYPAVHRLLEACYRRLLQEASEQLPSRVATVPTRMTAKDTSARFHGRLLEPGSGAIVVDIARGGMIPSHVFQMELMNVLEPTAVRVDHIYMQRIADPVTGAIVGVEWAGSKIGGPVADATVFIPDPMGATGSSIADAVNLYQKNLEGRPRRIVTCHLMVTPEYLRRVLAFDDVEVYALRLDRGMSPEHVLRLPPGALWSEESGLDAHGYIVPGAGGLGELINNAWV